MSVLRWGSNLGDTAKLFCILFWGLLPETNRYTAFILKRCNHIRISSEDVSITVEFTGRADLKEFYAMFFRGEYAWSGIEPKIIVDLGSNIGFSLAYFRLRYPKAVLYGFEPHPEAYRRAVYIASQNPNIHLSQYALSDQIGVATMHVSNYLSSSSLLPRSGATNTIQVDTMTLESVCAQLKVKRIDLLKIDIEGFEDKVLLGSPALKIVENIIGELHEDLMATPLQIFLSALRDAGFKIIACEPLAPGKPRYLLRAQRISLT